MSVKQHFPSLLTTFGLALAPSILALDEYMPVPVRVMQINAGFERSAISGHFQTHLGE